MSRISEIYSATYDKREAKRAQELVRQTRPYYTLLSRSGKGEPWVIEFGDYDKKVVQQEQADMVESYGSPLKMSDTKIIKTSAKQADIEAAVAAANA